MSFACSQSPVAKGDLCVVVGTGRSGLAAAQLLHALGAVVRVVDRDANNVSDSFANWAEQLGIEAVFGEHSASQFTGARFVVPSPGVPVAKLQPYLEATTVIMAEVELAWRCTDIPVLAVTGTNGKSTTVSLCAAMLEAAGKKVFLGGNIGTPLSEFVLDEGDADVLVLELSSFQLQTCRDFAPQVAVLTNLSPDHLDYHETMEEYEEAKMVIFSNQGPDDLALFGPELDVLPARYSVAAGTQYFEASTRFPEASLKGRHNRANMEAAWLATQPFGVTMEAAKQAVQNFSAAPHTMEVVAENDGVLFVNDSKATTVESMRAALETYDRPVYLLCGGNWKGGDLKSILPVVKQHVRAVGLFGGGREFFEAAWSDTVSMCWHSTMEEAAAWLMKQLRNDELAGSEEHAAESVLLLSPATSSFDQYSNYKVRGEDFRRIVKVLTEKTSAELNVTP